VANTLNKPVSINILGTRGIPAQHGGFETFAEQLALHLVSLGWQVTVYCQCEDGSKADGHCEIWKGVNLRFFSSRFQGALGTMDFDRKTVRDVVKQQGIDLVLGYNTAVFNCLERIWGRRILINMDGIEWKRAKWNFLAKLWFFINEIVGANISNVVIADHPEIAKHVQKRSLRKPVVIPYGADEILNAGAPPLELEPDRYFVSIARIEPENSILELVSAAAMLPASFKCVVLGTLQDTNLYHQAVRAAAGPNVVFPGAIYDKEQVAALRFHARAYLHGHQVGGTNPSLVEALGAGNAVLAHDNPFNRWTTGGNQSYFSGTEQCGQLMARLSTDDALVANARRAARARHNAAFRREYVLDAYAEVIRRTAHGESCRSLSFRWKE